MSFLQSLKSARKGASKAGGEARKAVDELRALRARLLDERDALINRPRPFDEAVDAAERAVAAEAQRALDSVHLPALMRPGDGRGPRLDLNDQQVAALALAASRDGVVELIRARLEQAYADAPEPISAADKAAELERLDAQLLEVEMAEEASIRELERGGFEVMRREDADPRATLAADSEMK